MVEKDEKYCDNLKSRIALLELEVSKLRAEVGRKRRNRALPEQILDAAPHLKAELSSRVATLDFETRLSSIIRTTVFVSRAKYGTGKLEYVKLIDMNSEEYEIYTEVASSIVCALESALTKYINIGFNFDAQEEGGDAQR